MGEERENFIDEVDLSLLGIKGSEKGIKECGLGNCRNGSLGLNCNCEENKTLRNKVLKRLEYLYLLYETEGFYYYYPSQLNIVKKSLLSLAQHFNWQNRKGKEKQKFLDELIEKMNEMTKLYHKGIY
jgi:hypothetical protein